MAEEGKGELQVACETVRDESMTAERGTNHQEALQFVLPWPERSKVGDC